MIGALWSLLEPISLTLLLFCIGLLSRRLGDASEAPPRYHGFFVGALLMGISAAARVIDVLFVHVPPQTADEALFWVLVYRGLPALALTLGLIGAWRYWSWLLAERA